jgi:hypothetical protein
MTTHERREQRHYCCFGEMREIAVGVANIVVFICPRCHERSWWIGREEISARLALELCRRTEGIRP